MRKSDVLNFLKMMYDYRPRISVGWIVLLFLLLVFLLWWTWKKYGCKKMFGTKILARILFLEYIAYVLVATVFSRADYGVYRYNFELFWSYKSWINRETNLLPEIICNIIMMVPYGIISPLLKRKIYKLKQIGWFFDGVLFSIVIEILQLVFRKGLCELDDVFNNTIGLVIGYCIYYCFIRIFVRKGLNKKTGKYNETNNKNTKGTVGCIVKKSI